jgi:hypothetical protein
MLFVTSRDIQKYRFLALQIGQCFLNLAARRMLYGIGDTRYHVPSEGILRARMPLDTVVLTVVPPDDKKKNPAYARVQEADSKFMSLPILVAGLSAQHLDE